VTDQPALGFSGLLRELRLEARLTQEELAEAAEVSPRTVSDLERGVNRTAHKDTAGLLADALGLVEPVRGLFVAAARGRAPAAEVLAARADAPTVLAAAVTGMSPGPAATPVAVPRELPADVAAFTGRAIELAELDLLLPGPAERQGGEPGPVVISVVSGTAGVGKTALAVRWAHRVQETFPDGQLYVNLCGYDLHRPVPAAEALAGFLRALGVASPDIPLEEAERAARYRSLVAGKRLLVVLDNAATEDQVRPLLPGTGSVMVVVTSRDALAGLVALDGARRLDLDLLPAAEAVALLHTLIGRRAEADPMTTQALAGLCARLPLALRVAAELAAARPDTPLTELIAELAGQGDRLELLKAGGDPRGAVAGVFSWSYRHLPDGAARMFRLLGLHPGPEWDRYAAAALTGTGVSQAGQLLAGLARAHLIQVAGPGRYGMHDLLRAYAASLAVIHDHDETRRAALTGLFGYYQGACAAAMDCLAPAGRHHRRDPLLVGAPLPEFGDPAAARAWLDAELTTLTAVAAYAAGHGWPGHTIRLAATIPEARSALPAVRRLRALLRRRVGLDGLSTDLRNRIRAIAAHHGYDHNGSYWVGPGRRRLAGLGLPATSREIVSDCLAVIDNLTPLIDQLDAELHQHAMADPRVKMLTSVPGIGEFAALLTLAEIGDVTQFGSARELASWPELIPTARGSGLPIGRGDIAGQGSASLRRVYCQAAQTAKRSRVFAATHAAAAKRRGAKVVTLAITRKLVAHAWYLLVSMQVIDTSTPMASAVPPPRQP
jgi:transcriptional regulator with XRE-family HTH domain